LGGGGGAPPPAADSPGGPAGDPGVKVELASDGTPISVTRSPVSRTLVVGLAVAALAFALVLADRARRARRAVL
jgi:hypothetical protein